MVSSSLGLIPKQTTETIAWCFYLSYVYSHVSHTCFLGPFVVFIVILFWERVPWGWDTFKFQSNL